MRVRKGFTNVITSMILILVGILVGFKVYTELNNTIQNENMTGLWSVVPTLVGILIPAGFIFAALRGLGVFGGR